MRGDNALLAIHTYTFQIVQSKSREKLLQHLRRAATECKVQIEIGYWMPALYLVDEVQGARYTLRQGIEWLHCIELT